MDSGTGVPFRYITSQLDEKSKNMATKNFNYIVKYVIVMYRTAHITFEIKFTNLSICSRTNYRKTSEREFRESLERE